MRIVNSHIKLLATLNYKGSACRIKEKKLPMHEQAPFAGIFASGPPGGNWRPGLVSKLLAV
jgi:hypothetical protein